MFEPGDFVKIKCGTWLHNQGKIGMVCGRKKSKYTIVFNLIPNKITGKGEVWEYTEEDLIEVDLSEK